MSVMHRAGTTWKWPSNEDNIFCVKEKRKEKLPLPTMIHERDHWGASLPDFDFTVEFDTIPLTVTGVCSPEYDARWHTRSRGRN